MEGHTRTRTCFAAACAQMHIFVVSTCMYLNSGGRALPLPRPSRCPAADTCGAPCQHHPCCLIPPSALLTVGADGEVSRKSYLLPAWPSVLISVIAVSASLPHSGHFQDLFLFKHSSCHSRPYTALLFLEIAESCSV